MSDKDAEIGFLRERCRELHVLAKGLWLRRAYPVDNSTIVELGERLRKLGDGGESLVFDPTKEWVPVAKLHAANERLNRANEENEALRRAIAVMSKGDSK